MKKEPYDINNCNIYEYRFTSTGKKDITKVVQISPLKKSNYFNIGFGDLKEDGSIDDKVESNNSDLIKVIATLGQIIFSFLKENPDATLFFYGSTPQRTNVYNLILTRNFTELKKNYNITALVKRNQFELEIPFNPQINDHYLGFFIKKID